MNGDTHAPPDVTDPDLCPECGHWTGRHQRSQGCLVPDCECLCAPPFVGSQAPVQGGGA